MIELSVPGAVARLEREEIDSRLALCPSLPSLSSINRALQNLLFAEQRFSAQISEVVRRDPSLTSRLLRLVNSVYYGLTTPVNSIEEAVFYLGVRQIRQLTMVTPSIEDFQRLSRQCAFPWREFWQHCIAASNGCPMSWKGWSDQDARGCGSRRPHQILDLAHGIVGGNHQLVQSPAVDPERRNGSRIDADRKHLPTEVRTDQVRHAVGRVNHRR